MIGRALIVLPIIEWDFRTQRPQHLARRFARAGWRVFYCGLKMSEEPRAAELVEPGVWRLELPGDRATNPYRDSLSESAADRVLEVLGGLDTTQSLSEAWVMVQLPFWLPLAERIRERWRGRILFDCVDDFSSFEDHGDVRDEERRLARTSDLVSVSADALAEKLGPHARHLVIVRNGCEPQHFLPAANPGMRGGRPVIGYFGGIHEWFDAPLVEGLAASRPDWDFWLVGDTYNAALGGLREAPNVRFLGEVAYSALPRISSVLSAGIIPFRISPLTVAANPVKAYEMLAAGLPVVGSDLPELRRLAPWIRTATDVAGFARALEQAMAEGSQMMAGRLAFASGESWNSRFLELVRAMQDIEPIPFSSKPYPACGADIRQLFGLDVGLGDAALTAHLRNEVYGLRSEIALRSEEGARLRDDLSKAEGRAAAAEEKLLESAATTEQCRRTLDEVSSSRGGRLLFSYWRAVSRVRRLLSPSGT
jgi:hypothetical protein